MDNQPKPKKPSKAQIKRQADKKALEAVYTFLDEYFKTDDKDDLGISKLEQVLIDTILDIYDPEEPKEAQTAQLVGQQV